MRQFLRKCRAALGVGATWGATWALIFALTFLIIRLVDPDSIDPGEGPLRGIAIGAFFGFVSGIAFALLLAVTESRKTIRNLSVGRAALWGMLGTAAYPLLTPLDNSMVFFVCPVGAAVAAASVAIAKK
jgi:hypothetical protein